jgi:transposase
LGAREVKVEPIVRFKLTLFDKARLSGRTGAVEITENQYQRIADYLPRQSGNVSFSHLQVLNAISYVAEHGCKWRRLPRHLGNWHAIYTRMNRWSNAGVIGRVFVYPFKGVSRNWHYPKMWDVPFHVYMR